MGIPRLKHTPDILGCAQFLGHFANGSVDWHNARNGSNIGGSDVAAIVGASPWSSPLALWARKTGKVREELVQSDAMEWGTRLEPAVLQKFVDEHPDFKVQGDAGTWHHVDRVWQIANPDALFFDDQGEWGLLEIKTAMYEDDWREGVPQYYRTQIQWYLQTFGFKYAVCAVLFLGSRRYAEFRVDADEFEQDTNLAAVTAFRDNYLLADVQPDFDGSTSTYETVREMHPDIDPLLEVELGELGVHYVNAVTDFTQAERHLNEMKSRVVDAMGKAKKGSVDGTVIVTRQARGLGKPYLVMKK